MESTEPSEIGLEAFEGLVNLLELEEPARAKIEHGAFDYIAGGANDEITLRANRTAFLRYALRPRMLTGASEPTLSTTVLGTPVSMPVLVAPTAFHQLCHPDGELASALGAGQAGTVFTASTVSNYTLEKIAAAAVGPLWFQLYVYRDKGVTRHLVERAVAAGYGAVCLTVDRPYLGRRERDVRNKFQLPPGCDLANLREIGQEQMPATDEASAFAAYLAFVDSLWEPALTWADLEWLCDFCPVPVLVKGILTAEDARLALEHGAAGVIVSNHGGRQLDGCVSSLDALPEVVEAVAGRAEVYMDGGIRRGTDVLQALALGARAVLLGRPVLWGLALGGSAGVQAVLEMLRAELLLAMALAGQADVNRLDPHLLRRNSDDL